MFAVNAVLKNRLNIKKKRSVLHAIHEQISVVECDADVHTKTLSLPAERGLVDLLGSLRMEHDLLLDVGVLKKMASMQPTDVVVPKLEFVEKDSLDVIVSCCRSMRGWIQEDSRNRAIVLCSSPALRVRIATCLLIFLKTFVSNELALEHYYQVCYKTGFFNISPSVACSPPSLLRLLKDFSRTMRKNEKFEVPKLFLDQIIIHKLPSFDAKKGTHLMLIVQQEQRFLYSSMLQGGGVKWIKSCAKRLAPHAIQLQIPIEGEVSIKAYHIPQKMRTHTPRIPIFEITFHSATQCGRRSVTYRRHEIDNCKVYPGDVADGNDRQLYHRKFRVELCFTDEPQNSDDEVSSASAVDEDEDDDDDDDDDDEDDVVSSRSHTPSASTPVGGGFSGCGSCEQCISHQEEVKRALVAAAASAASASPAAASAFICPYIAAAGHVSATHVFHHHEHSHQHEHEHHVELKEPPPPPAKPAAVVAASAPKGDDGSTPAAEASTTESTTSGDAGAAASADADGAGAGYGADGGASGDADGAAAESVAGGGVERPSSPDRHVAQEPDPVSTPSPPVSSNARERRHHRSKTGTSITITSPTSTSTSTSSSSTSTSTSSTSTATVTTRQHRSVSSRSHRHHHHSSSRSSRHRSSRHHSSQHGSHRSSSSRHRSSRHHAGGGYSSATLPLRRHATDGGGGKSLKSSSSSSSSGGRARRNSIEQQISADEVFARELQQQLNSRSNRSVSGRTAASLLGALVNAATSGVDLITSHATGNSSNSRNNRSSSSRTPSQAATSSTATPARSAVTITEESDPLPVGSSESTPETEAEQRIQYFVDAMVSSGMTPAPPVSSSPQLPARNSQQTSSSLVDHDAVFARMLQQRFMEEEVGGDSPSLSAQSASPAASPLVAPAASGDEPAAAAAGGDDGAQLGDAAGVAGALAAPRPQRSHESSSRSSSHRRHHSGSRAAASSAMPAGQPAGGLDERAASSTPEEDENALLQEYMGFGRRRHRAGASSHTIRALPAFRVKAGSSYLKDDRECMICRQGFEESEILRTLPCIHAYHKHCVDQWLRINKKCPVCHTKIDDPMFSGAP